MKFRFKRGIAVPYEQQGYIYFKSLRFQKLPAAERDKIRVLCKNVGGYNWKALLEHVTTGTPVREVCRRHYIASPTTIYMALKRYYERFHEKL